MDKKIIKNYIYNLSYQLLVIIIPLITIPYVARILGPVGIGTFSYTNSIVNIFILLGAIGLNLYGQREIAYHSAGKAQYSRIFWELVILRVITLSSCIAAFCIFTAAYDKYCFIFLIQIIDIVAALIDISWLFQGLEEFKKIVTANMCMKILGLMSIFVFVKTADDLWLYVMIHSLSLLFGNTALWMFVSGYVIKVPIKNLRVSEHIKPALVLFIPQISISLYTLLDKTMIGALTANEAEVAYYEQAQKIIKMALTVITSMGTIMLSRIASVFAQGNIQKIKDYMMKTFRFVFMLAFPMCCGFIGISAGFVPWFFGSGYERVIPNMCIIAPVILFIGLTNVMGTQYLLPTYRQREFTASVICGAAVNIVLNLVLIPRYLSYGAAMATLAGEAAVMLVQFYFLRKDFQFIKVLYMAWKYLFSSLAMLGVLILLKNIMPVSFACTAIQILCGIATYGLCLLLLKEKTITGVLSKKLKKY